VLVNNVSLSNEELERYRRQIVFLGVEAQLRLKRAKVLVVGAGGLGSAALYYLVAAGVGEVHIVDSDKLELNNLNRQILYTTDDIGKYKADVAAERLRKLNPNVNIITYRRRFDKDLAEEIVPKVDLAIDALDNWETRFLLNEYCVKYLKPLIHAGVREVYGQLLVIMPGKGPCLRCLFPHEPKREREIPILSVTPGILGAMEALEAIKIITGYGEPAVGKLIIVNGKKWEFEVISVRRNPECPVCGHLQLSSS